MSPLLGSIGNASEYAYRSNLLCIPDPFDFTDLYNAEPGIIHTSGYVRITGIRGTCKVKVGAGTSYSLFDEVFDNGLTVTFDSTKIKFDSDSNPNTRFIYGESRIKKDQSINLSVITTRNSILDFSKTYTSNVSIGRSTQDWIIQTRPLDDNPVPFLFSNVDSTTINTVTNSNSITLSGLETGGYKFVSEIISGDGVLILNSQPPVTITEVENGDIISLRTTSSEYFNITKNITLKVGSYSTTWSVTTEPLDLDLTAFNFTDVTNQEISTTVTSDQITVSGMNVGLTTSAEITSGTATIELNDSGTFSNPPVNVINGDKIKLRLTSSSSYSTTLDATLKIGNTTDTWSVGTKAEPPPPPPPSSGGGTSGGGTSGGGGGGSTACVDNFVTYRYGVNANGCPSPQGRRGYYYQSTPEFSNFYFPVYLDTQARVRTVNDVFVAYLNRPCEYTGIDNNVNYLAANGYTAFVNLILGSSERLSLCYGNSSLATNSGYYGPYVRAFPRTNCGRSYTSLLSFAICSLNPTQVCTGTFNGSTYTINCTYV